MNVKQLQKHLKRLADNGLGMAPVAFRMDDHNATEIQGCQPVAIPRQDLEPLKVVLLIGTIHYGQIPQQQTEKQNADVQSLDTNEVRQVEENQAASGISRGHNLGQSIPEGN